MAKTEGKRVSKEAAIYLRVSTTEQTTTNQRRELHAVAKRHGPVDCRRRQETCCVLPWSPYDGASIRLVQSKSIRRGARPVRVTIPVGAPLKAALDTAAKAIYGPIILTSTDKKPWTAGGFRASWREACAKGSSGNNRFARLV